jgi:geranylgeranyl diphosphate synthase type I
MGMSELEKDFMDALKPKREIVNKALVEILRIGKHERLKKAMSHYPLAGGKRLRPILAAVTADAVSKSGELTIPFGCALELVHNFTLVHDDIMDNDNLRRGIPTVHKAFDTPTAIIAGDALFSLAFETISATKINDKTLRALIYDTAQTVRVIAEGQHMDMEFEKRMDVSEKEYLEMISKKTAILFSLATKGGAMIANGSKDQIKNASDYGFFLGLGFQVKDDILGVLGDEKVIGKPVGSDIRNGKKTMIAVKLLENLEGNDRARFLEIFGKNDASDDELGEVKDMMETCGAIKFAQDHADKFSMKAKNMLELLDESEDKKLLEEFADFVAYRKL